MHFYFAKHRHKQYKKCINLTVPWLILQSCLYKHVEFPVYSQGEHRFAKVARTLVFSQTDCSEPTGRYHHGFVVAGKHFNTGSKKKNLSHFTLICYTFCFPCNQLHNPADTMEDAYANFSIHLFFQRRLGTQWFPSLKTHFISSSLVTFIFLWPKY